MLNKDDLAEIDSFGEESEESLEEKYDGWDEDEEDTEKKYSFVPIMQITACAFIVLTLLYFKFFDTGRYTQVVEWYQTEASQEIELPAFEKNESKPESTPESSVPENNNQVLEKI